MNYHCSSCLVSWLWVAILEIIWRHGASSPTKIKLNSRADGLVVAVQHWLFSWCKFYDSKMFLWDTICGWRMTGGELFMFYNKTSRCISGRLFIILLKTRFKYLSLSDSGNSTKKISQDDFVKSWRTKQTWWTVHKYSWFSTLVLLWRRHCEEIQQHTKSQLFGLAGFWSNFNQFKALKKTVIL